MSDRSKQAYLKTFMEEHDRTMRVLRAYPADKLDLRPHPKLRTAKELAWVFVLETYLGKKVWNDEFAKGTAGATKPPEAPASWDEQLKAIDTTAREFHDLVQSADEATLDANVHFFTGPKQMGEITRKDWIWFLLHDQIHHRGQLSVYLRMADGKVPAIYGPSGDEQWT